MSDDTVQKRSKSVAPPRFSLLDVHLSGVRLAQAVEAILGYAADGARHYVCIFAADSLLKCRDTPHLAAVANAADMTLCDGMPLVFVGRKFAKLDMDRCYGPDVMLRTIEAGCARGLRHFFYGGCDEATVLRLEANLRAKFPSIRIAGHHVPPFRDLTDAERDAVVAAIDASGADIVWVGIGTPRQDYWVSAYRPLLKAPVLVAVGAAFNFHAGTVPQAPRWMMRCGLEWLFRLIAEPRRLWRRYLVGNLRFVLLVLRQWITRRPAPLGEVLRRPVGAQKET